MVVLGETHDGYMVMKRKPCTCYLLILIFFMLGAYYITAQVYFIRELLVIYFGNEFCLGIIFAAWFAGIGLGSSAGAKVSRKTYRIIPVFLLTVAALSFLPFLLMPVMRLLRAILELPSGGYASMAQIAGGALITICPFSFLVGFIFPVSSMVLSECNRKDGDNHAVAGKNHVSKTAMSKHPDGGLRISLVYITESAGSLAGGLAVSFLLISKFQPLLVFAYGALLLLSASFVLARRSDPDSKSLQTLFLILSLTCAAGILTGITSDFDRLLKKWRWNAFNNGLNLVESRDSRYQNIVLSESDDQYSIFVNGNFYGVYPDEYQSAVKAHHFLSQHPAPKHILLIGGGITGLLREILKHPVKSIDCLEFDPELFNMIYPILNPADKKALDDRRVRIFHVDGRRYVKEHTKKYDMVIVDAPDPSTALLNRLYTVDFFREVKKNLSSAAVFITGMSSSANYVSMEAADYNASLYAGLTEIFPFVMVIPGERNYFFAGTQHGLFSKDPAVLSTRFYKRNIKSRYFSPELFRWIVQKERIEFLENILRKKAGVLLNTDFHPVACYYNLLIWNMLSGNKDGFCFFKTIRENGIWWLLLAGTLIILSYRRIISSKNPKKILRFNCFWVVATTGCVCMAMEIVLIFMFQSFYGYIFEKIGLIVALFMAGITIGSIIMRTRLKKACWIKLKTLVFLEIIICIYVTSVPFMLHAFSGAVHTSGALFFSAEYLYYLLIFSIALFAGMEFPLICHMLVLSNYDSGYVAGRVDALDHTGACAGALFTGIILMPVLGINTTCLVMAFLKLTCICFLVVSFKYRQQ